MRHADVGRKRWSRLRKNRMFYRSGFVNPYPWMSSIEARVHLWLEAKGVSFSWRWFVGEAVNLKYLMPDYAPEFTLPDYKIVIIVLGNFWGTLPGVLDRDALAQVLLEEDGWTVVTLWEDDILSGKLDEKVSAQAPQLGAGLPVIEGDIILNPYGRPDIMESRREQLRNQGFARSVQRLEVVEPSHKGVETHGRGPRRRLRRSARTRLRRSQGTLGGR